MFNTLFHAFTVPNKLKSIIVAGAVLAGVASVPTAAFARHPGFRIEVVVPSPEVIVPCTPVQAPTQVWVAPVYQTVSEKVWVPDVTTTQIQRVVVPAQYTHREVLKVDFLGIPHLHREQIMVRPAYIQERPVTVVVAPGHYEIQTHQQLVCEGHWVTQG